MRILFLPAGFALLLASAFVPASAADQPAQPTPAEASPATQNIDETGQPGITIQQNEPQTEITEKRQNGQVTEIKVRKSKNNTYIIRPGQIGAPSQGAQQTHPAQWVVKEFGAGKQPKKNKAAPPPPPPSAPADQNGNAPEKK